VDTIDLKAATERDIVVMNTPGQNSNAVAELAFGMMLTNVRNHYDGSSGYELRGKTLALYGFGQVARNMHRLAKGFEMPTIAYDPFLKPEDIEATGAKCAKTVAELFSDAQFVSLHIPATPETTKSINYDLLASMPKNGVLINTARAEVIDEPGLLKAFGERSDLVYISDVAPTEVKDLEAQVDALEISKKAKRAFITPKKMGAQTSEANNNAGVAAAKQIVDFFEKGEKKFQVNKPGQTF
jgi:D-3-phosphoglycerate dehydrogenase